MAGAYHVPASYFRYHLEAPIPFLASVDARIQHGGRSDVLSEYRSLGIAYLRKAERLVQTGGVQKNNRTDRQQLHNLLNHVGRRPRCRGRNGHVLPGNHVQQAGLARIGPSEQADMQPQRLWDPIHDLAFPLSLNF